MPSKCHLYSITAEHTDWSIQTSMLPVKLFHTIFQPDLRYNYYSTVLKIVGGEKYIKKLASNLRNNNSIYNLSLQYYNGKSEYIKFSGKLSETLYYTIFKNGILDYYCEVFYGLENWYFVAPEEKFEYILKEFNEKASVISQKYVDSNIDSIKSRTVLLYDITEKARSILVYAFNHGYFNIPKDVNEIEIARHFDISINMVNKYLRLAENKTFKKLFT